MFHAPKGLFCEGVWAEIGCNCCSSSSENIAFHRRTALPRCMDHGREMGYIEHNRSIPVDMELGVGQYPDGVRCRLLCFAALVGRARVLVVSYF